MNLIHKGYPALAGFTSNAFIDHLEPLKQYIPDLTSATKTRLESHIPFILVVASEVVSAEAAMPLVTINGASGSVRMDPVDSTQFKPIKGLTLPNATAYLVVDIDTGRETLNVTPANALQQITQLDRSPLIIDEGVALALHFPDVLTDKKKFNCFSMLGSRWADRRVPAMWISYGKPRLGWCWENNPHTWLGSASCRRRLGP
jgi:hypothetical protein